ncbi:MAG: hypothetical protein Q9169_008050 [Polycauliona sp. 2 TL-2023]
MQFSTLFVAAALPFLISASPTNSQAKAERRSNSRKVARFELFPDPPPTGCSFVSNRGGGNGYIADPTGNDDSCFGYPPGSAIDCSGPFEQKEIDDIKKAVKEQATKDGQWKTTSVGDWTAGFALLTTAMEDRDTSAFDKTLDSVNVEDNSAAGQLTYYWYLKGDTISVTRSSCPGSLFDKN